MKKPISDYIDTSLKIKGHNRKWLANALGKTETTLSSKFKSDTFTANELITCATLLDMDLNKIKEEYMKNVFAFGNDSFQFKDMDGAAIEAEITKKSVDAILYEGDDYASADCKIIVLHGQNTKDGVELFTINNIGSGFIFQTINGYRLHQLRHLGGNWGIEKTEKTLDEVISECMPEEVKEMGAEKVLKKMVEQYIEKPTIL